MWSCRPLVAVCAAVLSLAVAPGRAVADPGDDADRAGKAVHQAEAVLEDATALARAAAVRYAEATAALPAAQHRVAVARGMVAAAITDANTATRAADATRAAYAKIAARFQQAQAHVAVARDRVDEIAQAAYKGSNVSRFTVLVEATGPQDMLDRLGLVDQIMHVQQQEVADLVGARRTVRTAQDKAGLAKRAAEVAEFSAKTKVAAATAAQASAVRAKAELTRIAEKRRAAVRVANAQRGAVLASYRSAKAEEQRVQDALREWSRRQQSSGAPDGGVGTDEHYAGGNLLMPVNGWKSSNFGERYDPYYRVWQLHAGTDFAAGGGSPIRAAASGRVMRAGWNGGYGNYTCLSHGRIHGVPFSTCYGHQSAILVHVGEYVRRGELIGRVGTTGASTGYHLHFETRFDGVPRNPLNYLPSCLC